MEPERHKRETRNTPGHAHQLNFSCYRRLPLLTDDSLRRQFLQGLAATREQLQFDVWAYVLMPNHVHVLVKPRLREYRVEDIRKAIKGGFAQTALKWHAEHAPGLHARLVQPDGSRRYWQRGKGYDRNLYSPPAIWNSIRYIHGNPVGKGLCESPLDWPWSSARWYEGMRPVEFEVDTCPVEPPDSSSGVLQIWWEPE